MAVEQVDREAAAHLLRQRGEAEIYCASVERGEQDAGDAVQAFAAHRERERERCAGVAEEAHHASGLGWTPHAIATAIREGESS